MVWTFQKKKKKERQLKSSCKLICNTTITFAEIKSCFLLKILLNKILILHNLRCIMDCHFLFQVYSAKGMRVLSSRPAHIYIYIYIYIYNYVKKEEGNQLIYWSLAKLI